MEISKIKEKAFAMPLTNPAYPRGPYRFYDREYIIVTYKTDRAALQAVVPKPLEIDEPIVKFEFIRMPDSTGFGDYTESGQVIPVKYKGEKGSYIHAMYLDCSAPIVGGRELWGFPKKRAIPKITHEASVVVGTLYDGSCLCARATLGYKHKIIDEEEVKKSLGEPNFLLKIIPHVDGTPRICELVRYKMSDIVMKGAWSSPACLDLHWHVNIDVCSLPVVDIVSAVHFKADLTLDLGEVVFDYLKDAP